jgi:DNA-binding transcriptional regulator YdaS (Cro superfamily)
VERAAQLVGGPQQLAARLGVSQPMVRAWMCGFVRPPDSHFFRLVDLLNEAEDRPPSD